MELSYKIIDDRYKIVKEVLIKEFKISNRLLTKLKDKNSIFLNSDKVFINNVLKIGDIVSVSFDYEEDNSNITPIEINLDIIYEDDCLLIINKPSGIPVHPSILHYKDSLSNGVCYYMNSKGINKKIRPVNRIDKDTSGLVIFAKNEYVQEFLIRQMKSGNFKKEYIAIVEGNLKEKKGTINAPIGRRENSIIERCVSKEGQVSITHYEVIKELEFNKLPVSIIKCMLETGRTHQIRVHMSYIGHPLLGDDLYGGNTNIIERQALHSYKVSFIHPKTQKMVSYEAPIPEDLIHFIC